MESGGFYPFEFQKMEKANSVFEKVMSQNNCTNIDCLVLRIFSWKILEDFSNFEIYQSYDKPPWPNFDFRSEF